MPKATNIAIEIKDPETGKKVAGLLEAASGVKTTTWYGSMAEKGALTVKEPPDILIIDDEPGGPHFFERLRTLRQHFPTTAIFVVSAATDPGHIVQVMKAGAKEYLMLPVQEQNLLGAVEEVRQNHELGAQQANVYSFISSKGGLGATVLAVNVAAALAGQSKGRTSALCDASFQAGDSTVMLDLVPTNTILELCKHFHRLDSSLLQGVMVRHSSSLDVLAAPSQLEDIDEITPDRYDKILELLNKHYRDIVIDCSSMRVDPLAMHSFNLSAKVFIVTDLSVPAIRNAARLALVMRQFGVADDKILFVVNRFTKTNLSTLGEAEKTMGKRAYWLFPNDFENIIASINEGDPMVSSRAHSAFSKNIHAFLEKIQGTARNMEYRGASGAFGRTL